VLNILYDIILLEPSILFHVTCDCVTVTLFFFMWHVTDVWHLVMSCNSSITLTLSLQNKKIKKMKIVGVYHLKLWHIPDINSNNYHIWFRWSFDNSRFRYKNNIIENIHRLNNSLNCIKSDRNISILDEIWNVQNQQDFDWESLGTIMLSDLITSIFLIYFFNSTKIWG